MPNYNQILLFFGLSPWRRGDMSQCETLFNVGNGALWVMLRNPAKVPEMPCKVV